MIFVKRGEAPSIFSSKEFLKTKNENYSFNQDRSRATGQLRFRRNRQFILHEEVISFLFYQFKSKCCYCEIFIETSEYNVEHFRPINGALGIRGEFSERHYWWLAYEWSNYYLACNSCSKSKGNRFPVQRKRCRELGLGIELAREDCLLLDPCGDLDPNEHLSFKEDGTVMGKSIYGETTIDVLGLNRENLVLRRKAEAVSLKQEFKVSLGKKRLSEYYDGDKYEFIQLRKQLLNIWNSDIDYYLDTTKSKLSLPKFVIPRLEKVEPICLSVPKDRINKLIIPALLSKKARQYDRRPTRARLVEKIRIENFKSITSLEVSFGASGSGRADWKIILGENGVGKSSILQALTLALCGSDVIENLGLNSFEFIKSDQDISYSEISVYLSGDTHPVILKIDREGFHYVNSPPDMVLISYGPHRILGANEAYEIVAGHADVYNLFEPSKKLTGLKSWLLGVDEETFSRTASAFRDVLCLNEKGKFSRDQNEIWFEIENTKLKLSSLSEGYQSLVAMVCHMVRYLLNLWPSLEVAEGIVVIDELDLHLHPTWKMRIVSSLRNAFPRVQFVCTTHDPLCLRGLEENEVEVIVKSSITQEVSALGDLPSIKGMRVDQILQSEHFGMNTTLDPELEKIYREYYSLLAAGKKSKNMKRIGEIRLQIDKYSVFGSTRRERQAMAIIDELIAEEATLSDMDARHRLKSVTRQRMKTLLKL